MNENQTGASGIWQRIRQAATWKKVVAVVLVVVLYGLSHIPCIIIQRYNRPRLCALLKRCQRKGKEPA